MEKIKKIFLIVGILFLTSVMLTAKEVKTTNLNEKAVAVIPAKISDYAVGETNGVLLGIGGVDSSGKLNKDAYVLKSLKSDKWEKVKTGITFSDAAYASNGKALFVVGGKEKPEAVREISYTNGKISIRKLTSLPKAMPGAGIAVMKDSIYVLGSGKPNFMSLNLTAKNAKWKIEPECPVSGITDPLLAVQSPYRKSYQQLVVLSYKKDGKPCKDAKIYRPVPTDGENGAVKDKGWHDISDPSIALEENNAVPEGEAHVTVYAKNKVFVYHLITDSWDETCDLVNKFEHEQSVAFADGALLMPVLKAPTKSEQKAIYAAFSLNQHKLKYLDWIVIGLYFLLMLGIGIYFAKKEKSTDDFFLGGRKIPWWAAGISIYATGTSAYSFMAIPAQSFATNMVYFIPTLIVSTPVTIFIAAKYVIPIVRKLNCTTTFEYLENRFSPSLRLLGSFLQITFQLTGRMAVVLMLPAMAISAVTGLNPFLSVIIMGILATAYTTLGGMAAVIWTDVIQFVVLFGGALLVLILLICGTDGGFGGFISTNLDYNKLRCIDWSFNFQAPVIWIFIIGEIIKCAGILNDQANSQRFLATSNVKEAQKSLITMQIVVIPSFLLFAILGLAFFSYFKSHPAAMNPTMSNAQILPTFILQSLPAGVSGLILAGLFAACMSTLDSGMNSTATMIVHDFYRRLKKKTTDHECLVLGKWLNAIVGLVGTCTALYMISLDIGSIFDLFNRLTALMGGGFIGVFTLAIFTKRTHNIGAWIGVIASITVTWTIPLLKLPVNAMVYTPISILSCIIVGYFFSVLTPQLQKKDMTGLTVFTLEKEKV